MKIIQIALLSAKLKEFSTSHNISAKNFPSPPHSLRIPSKSPSKSNSNPNHIQSSAPSPSLLPETSYKSYKNYNNGSERNRWSSENFLGPDAYQAIDN